MMTFRMEGDLVVTTMTAYVPEDADAPWVAETPKKEVATTLILKDGAPYKAMIEDGKTVFVEIYPFPARPTRPTEEVVRSQSSFHSRDHFIFANTYNNLPRTAALHWTSASPSRANPKVPDALIWACHGQYKVTYLCGATPLVTLNSGMRMVVKYWDRSFDDELRKWGAFDLLDSVIHL